jgi:hypothetical protein
VLDETRDTTKKHREKTYWSQQRKQIETALELLVKETKEEIL